MTIDVYSKARMPSEQLNFDIMRLTDDQRRTFFARLRTVHAWQSTAAHARERHTTRPRLAKAFLRGLRGPAAGISYRTLQLWLSEYRAAGPLGLVDQRWTAGLATRYRRQLFIALFLKELARQYTGPGLLSFNTCYLLTQDWARERGEAIATRRESRRYLRAYVLPKLTRERTIVRRPGKGRSSGN